MLQEELEGKLAACYAALALPLERLRLADLHEGIKNAATLTLHGVELLGHHKSVLAKKQAQTYLADQVLEGWAAIVKPWPSAKLNPQEWGSTRPASAKISSP